MLFHFVKPPHLLDVQNIVFGAPFLYLLATCINDEVRRLLAAYLLGDSIFTFDVFNPLRVAPCKKCVALLKKV